jgi:hypothetical protein
VGTNCGTIDEQPFPDLTLAAVQQLSATWDDGGLWEDVLFLADRFWAANEEGSRLMCWHHLVLAVGNFKRQTGRRLRPSALHDQADRSRINRPGETLVPTLDGPGRLCVDESKSWRMLSGTLPGAGVPTTTTILAALWPDQHFIFDWRVHAAANALRIHAGLVATVEVQPASTHSPPLTFNDYELVRRWILETAAHLKVQVAQVERSLYQLSRQREQIGPRRGRSTHLASTNSCLMEYADLSLVPVSGHHNCTTTLSRILDHVH